MTQIAHGSPAEYAIRTVALRGQLRDAIQTLSNARRSEVWEIVNELIAWETLERTPEPPKCPNCGERFCCCDDDLVGPQVIP